MVLLKQRASPFLSTPRLHEHGCRHFRSNRNDVKDTTFLTDRRTEVSLLTAISNHETISDPVKTFREFKRYVSRMADRKAAGKDKMPADLFKRAPEAFHKRAWSLINKILAGKYTCSPEN